MKSKIHTIKIERLMIFLIWFLMSVTLSLGIVTAADHTVGGSDFDSIQNVVDSSASNDRILLGSKTYTSSGSVITVGGNKNLTIQGQSNSNRATLNANNLHGILYIRDGSSVTIRYVNFVNGGLTGHALGAYGTILIENCNFSGSRGDSGAAIVVTGTASNSIIRNCNFTNNYADNHGDNDYTAGGAICVHGADNVEIRNCYFSGNKALDNGGALVIRGDATNTRIISCTFINNQAPNGGAILNQLATTTITGCTFTNNKATNVGGAIYSISSLNIVNSNFNNNNAKNGGAIYNTNSLRVTGSNFATNTAENGGAIYSTSAVNIGSSSFNKNTAKNNGGGIYTIGTSRSTITGSKFTSNSAKNGGGIYNNAPLAISTSNLVSNEASANGGGIYANKNLNITGGNIKSNTASYGSGVYNVATLRISKVAISSNIAKVISISLKAPKAVKPYKNFNIYTTLKTGDNIFGAIYNKNGNTYVNGSRKATSSATPGKTFVSTIAGKKKNIKSNSNGIATRSSKSSKSNIVVKVSYSQGSKTWSTSGTIKVTSAAKKTTKTYTNKKSTTNKPATNSNPSSNTAKGGSSVKISFDNHENAHLASLINLSNYNVNSKKISYWNLKKNSHVVTDYYYMVNKDGWYQGTNNNGVVKWTTKLSKVPTTSGNWISLTKNSNGKYSTGKVVVKHTNTTSDNQLMYFVSSRKTSINHKSLAPYICYNYTLTNKKTGSKITYYFYEKSDDSIYLLIDDSSKKLKDYNDYLVNSKKAPTDNKAITSLTKNIISKIGGELTPTKKAEALFNWVRDNIAYPPKSRFYECTKKMATGTLSSKEANCVDQSSLLISMLRTAKIPSQYIHYKNCTFSSGSRYGHVWVSAFVGKWTESDTTSRRNFFGIIVNFSNRKVKHGPHIIIDI